MHGGIRARLGRLKRLFPIVGAGIVLLTFVVKDAWRDHLKDVIDSIDQAEADYSVREDNLALSKLLNNIYQRVRYPSNQESDVDLIASGDSYQVYLVVLKVQEQTASSLQLVSTLVEHLPDEEGKQTLVKDLQRRSDALRDHLTTIEDIISRWSVTHTTPSVPAPALPEFQTIRHDTSVLSSEVHTLERSVRKDAEEQKRSAEFRYELWTFVSYALYTLGWTLGLIGQIYGVKVGAQGE